MGQKNWAGACALVVAMGAFAAAPSAWSEEGAEVEANPFDRATASPSEGGHGPAYATRRIERILDQPLKSPLQYPETPLNTITGIISEEYELPVVFDTAALDVIAVSPEAEVSVDLQNITLRSALDLMLEQIEDLAYVVDHEVLLITTHDEAETRIETRLYRIDDLQPCEDAKSPTQVNSPQADFNLLIHAITSCVEHDSWAENGKGQGAIQSLPPGILVVSQTARVHRQVTAFLADVRRVKGEIEGDGVRKVAERDATPVASGAADEEDGN